MAPLKGLTSSVRPPPLPRRQAAGSRSFPSRYLSPPFRYLDEHGKENRSALVGYDKIAVCRQVLLLLK
jgi:hypothetical protein